MASMTAFGTCVPPGPSRKATGWPPKLRRSDGKSPLQSSDCASPKVVRDTASRIACSPKKAAVTRRDSRAERFCRGPCTLRCGHLGRQHRVTYLAVDLCARLRRASAPAHADQAAEVVRARDHQLSFDRA